MRRELVQRYAPATVNKTTSERASRPTASPGAPAPEASAKAPGGLPASAFSEALLEAAENRDALLSHLHLARYLVANPEALPVLGRALAPRVEALLP